MAFICSLVQPSVNIKNKIGNIPTLQNENAKKVSNVRKSHNGIQILVATCNTYTCDKNIGEKKENMFISPLWDKTYFLKKDTYMYRNHK